MNAAWLARRIADRARPSLGLGRWTGLLDGGSGSGKTATAEALVALWREHGRALTVVSMDSFYPGWDGLAAGAEMVVADVLDRGGHRRWDWSRDRPGEWVQIDPGNDLLVEGCGAITPASRAYADLAVWLEMPADRRRRRALSRDGDRYAPHWERWAAQEARHRELHHPELLADLVLRP